MWPTATAEVTENHILQWFEMYKQGQTVNRNAVDECRPKVQDQSRWWRWRHKDQQMICAFRRCQDLNVHTILTAITDPEKESKLPGQVPEPVWENRCFPLASAPAQYPQHSENVFTHQNDQQFTNCSFLPTRLPHRAHSTPLSLSIYSSNKLIYDRPTHLISLGIHSVPVPHS